MGVHSTIVNDPAIHLMDCRIWGSGCYLRRYNGLGRGVWSFEDLVGNQGFKTKCSAYDLRVFAFLDLVLSG